MKKMRCVPIYLTLATMIAVSVLAEPALPATRSKGGAECGPKDQPETGLQGQVPLADQLSGRSQEPYFCGLTLVGQNSIEDRGNNHQLTWWKTGKTTCAYFGTLDRNVNDPLSGVAVLDVSDPADPQVKTILRDPGTVNTVETLQAKSGILLAKGNSTAPTDHQYEASAIYLAVYDISKDCLRPRLKSSFELPGQSHGGGLSPDGKTVYAQSFAGGVTYVVDISNPSRPKLLLEAPFSSHDLAFNLDGTRVYFADGQIFDTSSIQHRRPNPEMRLIGQTIPPAGGHTVVYARVKGRPYLLTSKETFRNGYCDTTGTNVLNFDLSHEKTPVLVSEFRLEVNEPENCTQAVTEDGTTYGSHYGSVDNPRDATFAMWTWFSSGTRIIDIRDILHPKEVAYYNPGASDNPSTLSTSSPVLGLFCKPVMVDCSTAYPQFIPHTGHIWTAAGKTGFLVLELQPQVKAALGLNGTRR
ncbi:MAG: LVIVD repeat-containing protein [Actinomycetota bacterium]